MAVVKSPKNNKRKQLWLKKISSNVSNTSVNTYSNSNKLFKVKVKKWINTKSKSSVVKSLLTVYTTI